MSMPSRARIRPPAPPVRPAAAHGRPRASDRVGAGGTGTLSGSGPGARAGTPRAAAGGRQPGRGRPRPRLTGRGAVLVMLAVFLFINLIAAGVHSTFLNGFGYAAGCLLAVAYARREAMLVVVTTPPAIFLISLVAAKLMTTGGNTVVAAAEGTLLTLAALAPWLFGVTIACVAVATVRGLPRCVQQLRSALAGGQAALTEPDSTKG
jgi:hypothetical protein